MRFCDYFGTWVFAISGTLTAATSGLDLLGCVVVGSITALGGGTARDMIMGQVPLPQRAANSKLTVNSS